MLDITVRVVTMVHRLFSYIMCLGLIISLPSCIKYYELSRDEWPQAEKTYDRREIAHNFIRSITIYEQFRTQASFDVLWLSDAVRRAYVERVASSRGKNKEAKNALLSEELIKNRTAMSFIVLADIRARDNNILSEKKSHWSLYLKTVDGKTIESDKIQEVEAAPAYRYLFGHRFVPVKTAYLVSFPLQSLEGSRFFNIVDRLEMVFSSPDLKNSVVWDPKDYKYAKELLPDEDFYWC